MTDLKKNPLPCGSDLLVRMGVLLGAHPREGNPTVPLCNSGVLGLGGVGSHYGHPFPTQDTVQTVI